ncbi:hypothetical protein CF328_g4877 [Tilletia controversa]|nr:hypothetical protein CF328_g4877 [Tilletia controversa]
MIDNMIHPPSRTTTTTIAAEPKAVELLSREERLARLKAEEEAYSADAKATRERLMVLDAEFREVMDYARKIVDEDACPPTSGLSSMTT